MKKITTSRKYGNIFTVRSPAGCVPALRAAFFFLPAVVLLGLLAGFSGPVAPVPPAPPTPPAPAGASARPGLPEMIGAGRSGGAWPAPAGKGGKTPDRMLELMIGQMIMVGFEGSALAPDSPTAASIRAGRCGGVILFERGPDGRTKNIESPAQLRLLAAQLQEAAAGTDDGRTETAARPAAMPLFIAVDQEGGRVQRLRPERGFAGLAAAAVLGRGSVEATRQAGLRCGLELRACGINLNFAPVADVNVNPLSPAIGALQRSFGRNPARVGAHALAFGLGLAEAGVMPCLKHFPGHGSAREDSHENLPDISASWRPQELLPFRTALAGGPENAGKSGGWPGAVMPGHLMHRGLDAFYPAGLSRRIIDGLLRGRLGFAGLVISDDLQMGAVAARHTLEERVRLAAGAGVDILLFGNNAPGAQSVSADEIHALLLRLVLDGRISGERIRRSWERISAAKRRFAGAAGKI